MKLSETWELTTADGETIATWFYRPSDQEISRVIDRYKPGTELILNANITLLH